MPKPSLHVLSPYEIGTNNGESHSQYQVGRSGFPHRFLHGDNVLLEVLGPQLAKAYIKVKKGEAAHLEGDALEEEVQHWVAGYSRSRRVTLCGGECSRLRGTHPSLQESVSDDFSLLRATSRSLILSALRRGCRLLFAPRTS